MKKEFIKSIKNKLIVSCQAVGDEPLNNSMALSLVAKSVINGGAEVLRLSQIPHIIEIQKITNIPIIGLIKKRYENSDVYITPTISEIDELVEIGIKCIAIDATLRIRPNQNLNDIVKYAKTKYKNVTLMADCSTIEEVKNAEKLGFDLIGTTLRGYTKSTIGRSNIENNYEFIRHCLKICQKPLIAEGGIWEPKEVKDLFELGCFSVVVGSAITRPEEITKRFIKKIKQGEY